MQWLVLTCGLLLMAAPVFAATQNAMLYGTVYDAAGNPMAGATVILENPALGFTRTTTTGSDGSYNFAEVPPAEGYRVTAAKGGTKLDIRAGITVNVGDERVILPPLKEQAATAAAPVVEKKAEASAVTNEMVSSTVSGVITGDQLRSLPLYNRNFLALGLLTPNTHDTEANSELLGASFSVSGNRPNQNNFLLDGSDNVASSSNQAVPFQVNDSVQEFRLISSNASAEYGRNAGGTVNVVTRRGGNGFHGSVFGYWGNDVLNADNPLSVYNGSTFDSAAAYAGPTSTTIVGPLVLSDFSPLRYNSYVAVAEFLGFCTDSLSAFTGVAGTVACTSGGTGGTGKNTRFDPAAVLAANNRFKPSFDSKQFGVNAGGPLVKDKVFWFLSYEGTLIKNPNPIFERVPTRFDKTYDPFATGNFNFPVTGGQQDYPLGACTSVTAACGSARGILSLFPNSNVVGVPGVLEFFRGQAPNFTHVHNGLARVDIMKSAANNFTIRYVAQGLNQLHDDTLPVQPNYPGNGAFRGALNQNINATWSHTFSTTLINEVRFAISRFNVSESAQDASFDATTLGLTPNIYPAASNFPNRGLSTILLNGMDAQYSGATPGTDGAYCSWFEYFAVGPCQAPTLDYLFPYARLGAPLNAPSSRRDDTWTLADSVSWSHGKHGIKFGVEYRNLNNHNFDGAWQRGLVYSSDIGEFTSDSSISCNQVCPGGFSESFRFPTFDFAQSQTKPYNIRLHSWAFAGYMQDTWRISPRFTVNLGLRYQYLSVPEERNDQLWNYDPVANGLVRVGHAGV
ncbi:MAG TPA: TonB-dependent receptor, partial [Terriglobales bacterium]|nr:TonB-dependent receptor [Terriglobales bacterium]